MHTSREGLFQSCKKIWRNFKFWRQHILVIQICQYTQLTQIPFEWTCYQRMVPGDDIKHTKLAYRENKAQSINLNHSPIASFPAFAY